MSGSRPRFSFSRGSSSGSGISISMSMLDSMFPDSLWKYGTLSEPVEEVYEVENEPKRRTKRKVRRKTINKKRRKRRLPIKNKVLLKPKKRRRRSMVKPRKIKFKRQTPRPPTLDEFLRSQSKSRQLRKKTLEMAVKMKTRAIVKGRQARLERRLFEIHASSARLHGRKFGATRNIKIKLAKNSRLRDAIRTWQRIIDKSRAEEAVYRNALGKMEAAYRKALQKKRAANPSAYVPAPFPRYLYS